MDGIFWAPQIKKRLQEEEFFPAKEELLRILEEYKLREDEINGSHQISKTPLSLMPHTESNYPLFHFSFYKKKNISLKWTLVFIIPLFFFIFSASSFFFVERTLVMREQMIKQGTDAAFDLEKGAKALAEGNYTEAEKDFDNAHLKLTKAQHEFNVFGAGIMSLVSQIPFSNPIRSGDNMLEAALHLSLSGRAMVQLQKEFSSFSINNLLSGNVNSDRIINLSATAGTILDAASQMTQANDALKKVSAVDIPASFLPKFNFLKDTMDRTSVYLNALLSNQKTVLAMLGEAGPRRYLLLFQNSSEIRATGGFIGNVALLKIADGSIEKFKFYDVYDLDGQLAEHIVPPRPIQDISSAWSLHDANWFFDFPSSARKINSFYEKEGGATLDGVIALNSSVAEDLLSVLGPVQLTKDADIINAENLIDKLNEFGEKAVSNDDFNQRMALEEIFNTLLGRLGKMNSEQALALARTLNNSILRKDIQVFLNNNDEQNFVSTLGIGGTRNNRTGDALAIVHSNINGFKTDRVIEEKIDLEKKVNSDGSTENILTIKRKHNGKGQKYDFYRRVNKDYIRIYVPQGSSLSYASGLTADEYSRPIDYDRLKFVNDADVENIVATSRYDESNKVDIFEEYGSTVFGGWAFVSPGEELTLIFKYITPAKRERISSKKWNFMFEKQSGLMQDINLSITFPKEWIIKWNALDNIVGINNTFIYSGKLTGNKNFEAQINF